MADYPYLVVFGLVGVILIICLVIFVANEESRKRIHSQLKEAIQNYSAQYGESNRGQSFLRKISMAGDLLRQYSENPIGAKILLNSLDLSSEKDPILNPEINNTLGGLLSNTIVFQADEECSEEQKKAESDIKKLLTEAATLA